jgi:hypothetical protein
MDSLQKLIVPQSSVNDVVNFMVINSCPCVLSFTKDDMFGEAKVVIFLTVNENAHDEFHNQFDKYIKKF